MSHWEKPSLQVCADEVSRSYFQPLLIFIHVREKTREGSWLKTPNFTLSRSALPIKVLFMVFIVVAHVVVIGCNKDIQYFLPHTSRLHKNNKKFFAQMKHVPSMDSLAKHIHSTCSALLYCCEIMRRGKRERNVENVFKVLYWIIFCLLLIKKGENSLLPSLPRFYLFHSFLFFSCENEIWNMMIYLWRVEDGRYHVLENRLVVLNIFNAVLFFLAGLLLMIVMRLHFLVIDTQMALDYWIGINYGLFYNQS